MTDLSKMSADLFAHLYSATDWSGEKYDDLYIEAVRARTSESALRERAEAAEAKIAKLESTKSMLLDEINSTESAVAKIMAQFEPRREDSDTTGQMPVVHMVMWITKTLLARTKQAERERLPSLDLVTYIRAQREWSEKTFGHGEHTDRICDRIHKEFFEIKAAPHDILEWIDVAILALDGAWRAGYTEQQIIDALKDKQLKNFARAWPDWRTAPPNKAIEHVRAQSPSIEERNPVDINAAALARAEAAEAREQRLIKVIERHEDMSIALEAAEGFIKNLAQNPLVGEVPRRGDKPMAWGDGDSAEDVYERIIKAARAVLEAK
jgi:hypothetical protein